MKTIKLTHGFETIVDDEDYEYLSQWPWHATSPKSGKHIYACRKGRICEGDHRQTILMHRIIINVPDNLKTDHINGNGLDNRRSNLRMCTDAQNGYNSKKKGKTSKYKGVTWRPRSKQWAARIAANGICYNLGLFTNEHAAAYVYNLAAEYLFGEFARLNIIPIDLLLNFEIQETIGQKIEMKELMSG